MHATIAPRSPSGSPWTAALLVLAPAMAIAGCAPGAELVKLRADTDRLVAQQQQVLDGQKALVARVDDLEKWRKDLLAAIKGKGGGDEDQDASTVYAVPVGESAVAGAPDAWITLVEFSDFQCPFCGRAEPTVSALREKYGKDLRVVFKHNPLEFHPAARPAAIAAECAHDQGKFWPMHDKLFENQQSLDPENFERYARELKLDMKKWKACYSEEKPAKRIDADMELAEGIGARGTPYFYVNGRVIRGAQRPETFQHLIDEELAKAKASGVPADKYYEKNVVAVGKKGS